MDKKRNRMKVPCEFRLGEISLSETAQLLEECGVRVSVEQRSRPMEYPYRPLTVVTVAHTDTKLYIEFLVRCNFLRAVNFVDNQGAVSEDSCVGFYVKCLNRKDEVFAIQCNCIGTINAAFIQNTGERNFLTAKDVERIERYASVGSRPFQEVEGSFIWSVTLGIPLDLIGVTSEMLPVTLLGNFDKCASATSQPHFLSWQPCERRDDNDYLTSCFGEIVLEK